MKMKLFEYVILLHPEKPEDAKSEIIHDVVRILAKDEKQVGILASRMIPEDRLNCLDRIEIIVRPF